MIHTTRKKFLKTKLKS